VSSNTLLAQEGVPGDSVPFPQCIASLQDRAKTAGVSEKRVNDVLGQAKYRDKIISYDRNQPEFVKTFPNYLNKRVNDWRINKGREMYKKHRAFLQELTQQYGVPAHYLVSFWGLETNFGTYKGKIPIIDSLVTLACDQRRSEFFSKELMQALLLMDRENFEVETMIGSWAGAMGHTQFMPSAYMRYAIDGDNDGRVDLWNSELDALASAANFLNQLGWVPGFRWGREVSLPESFDYQNAGKDKLQNLAFWSDNGVTKTDGKGLGAPELEASLLVPAGHRGPAFLAYKNFDIIMRWNNSEFYAIAVGYLADRILGHAPLSKTLPELEDYSVADMLTLQESLNALGFDVGEADGILGPATRKGIRGFQVEHKLIADGFPDKVLIDTVAKVAANLSASS
jgi:membrane-bound lytic murein transglycosylase B